MASKSKQAIADVLSETGLLLGEAIKPEITAHMSVVGYDSGQVEHGMALRSELERQHLRAQAEHADEVGAARALDEAIERALDLYGSHRKLARAYYGEDPQALTQLGLLGRRRQDAAGAIRQGLDFYGHALGDEALRQGLAAISIGDGVLREGLAAFQEVERLRVELQREAAEAYQARADRDAARDALHAWVTRYKALAREVLKPYPALLRQLGLA